MRHLQVRLGLVLLGPCLHQSSHLSDLLCAMGPLTEVQDPASPLSLSYETSASKAGNGAARVMPDQLYHLLWGEGSLAEVRDA